ncbi:MAG: hypothetical protein ABWY64_25770 [Tardiphaga sp.]
MREGYYILDADNHVVPVDMMTWARWLEENNNNRSVGYTEITSQCRVSTVFVSGLDLRFEGDGPPILFETMIFGGPLDDSQWRYASYDDAVTGHQTAVTKARKAIGQKVTP